MNRRLGLSLALLLLTVPAAAEVFRYVAFGDSITAGIAVPPDNGTCTAPPPIVEFVGDLSGLTGPECGYPPRLEALLGCTAATCTVDNEGFSDERTVHGLTRIETVLDTVQWDVLLLMEGTLDIFFGVSLNTIEFNLKEIAKKAALRGTDTVHTSLMWFHPAGTGSATRNPKAEDLRDRIDAMAVANNRYFADQWSELCPPGLDRHGHTQSFCFGVPGNDDKNTNDPNTDHYVDTPPDPVGHPDADGYQMMAQRFFETITQNPVPGPPVPGGPSGYLCDPTPTVGWTQESPATATWYRLQVQTASGAPVHDALYPARNVLDGNGALAVGGICSGTTCTETLSALAPDSYRWRVRGRNPAGYGIWTGFTSFAIPAAVPAPPTPLAPTGGLEVFDSTPTYTWSAVAGAEQYALEIDGGGPQQYDATTICTGSTCSVAPPSLPLTPGAHSWRVRASNCLGDGAYGTANDFTVLDCAAFPAVLELDDPLPPTEPLTERACQEIRAAKNGDYTIDGSRDVTFHAGNLITLYEGFAVGSGASFTAQVDWQ